MEYPKRLIEVDLPIKRISAHARREKSIRHGHISTLHIWWARRPLAACRAVICAALWPDPADPLCPQGFRDAAAGILSRFAESVYNKAALHGSASVESFGQWEGIVLGAKKGLAFDTSDPIHLNKLRFALLDFIADFANWDNSTVAEYLEASRALTQAAHESLGGAPGTRPLVVDPFAGGGSIPLEALRVGADAFASDLNPIPVLLNKVVLEYIPKYGQRLADEVRTWGEWIKREAEKELSKFYPDDPDGATPIAYLWARTILSEAPGEGDIPVEVPLMRSLWLAKKAGRRRALRWLRDEKGVVKTQTVEVTYVEDGQRVVKRVRRPLLEIFEPAKESDVGGGTVARGSATCPVTGYTTKVDRVRAQLKSRRGGAADSRLFCVVTTGKSDHGKFYRLPEKRDQEAFDAAAGELERREKKDGTQRSQKGRREEDGVEASRSNRRSLVPDELLDMRGIRHTWAMIYGLERWGDYFSPRQTLALTTIARLVREVGDRLKRTSATDPGLSDAVMTCLACSIGKCTDYWSTIATWMPRGTVGHSMARQAIPMTWDFPESSPFADFHCSWVEAVEWTCGVCEEGVQAKLNIGTTSLESATNSSLPNDSASAFITDPPYYDAVPYAYLSDFFYVWMRRTLADAHPSLFREGGVPKDAEIVVDRPHQLSQSTKDIAFYERELTRAFAEGRRVLAPSGIGTIVFASKTTASWEAILKAVIDAGFIITGSWPIDTEREARVAAQGQARLASSVHLVCRPREHHDGSLRTDEVGDWRDVLHELPRRIHEWMPRLAEEGVVGADAIFSCLGPALEVFSRYSRVEKASGEVVSLKDYLVEVWAAVSNEALSLIFKEADTGGLEPDARLTAMWLWTLSTGGTDPGGDSNSDQEPDEEPDDDDEESEGRASNGEGFSLEFDAARKIAQGLGANLESLTGVVEVKGKTARLLPVAERTRHLFGKGEGQTTPTLKKPRARAGFLKGMEDVSSPVPTAGSGDEIGPPRPGVTVLDRVHQAMILFGTGRAEALKAYITESRAGNDARFWKLAQSLSALYPAGTNEKRWVDGVLARKKGLGF